MVVDVVSDILKRIILTFSNTLRFFFNYYIFFNVINLGIPIITRCDIISRRSVPENRLLHNQPEIAESAKLKEHSDMTDEACCQDYSVLFVIFYMHHPTGKIVHIPQPLLYQLCSTGWNEK